METAYPDPSQILPFEFKINRQADIYFTLLQDGAAISSVTGWTWALNIKKYPGSRNSVLNLTLGNGLTYDTYSDIVLHAHFTSSQTSIDEGEYFIELIRTDIEKTWMEGKCFFRFAKVNSQDTMSSELTIDVNSTTQAITINVISGRIINVGSTPSLQTAYDNGNQIVLAASRSFLVKDASSVNIFEIDNDKNVTLGNSLADANALSQFVLGMKPGATFQILINGATTIMTMGNTTWGIVTSGTASLNAGILTFISSAGNLTDGASITLTRNNHTLTTTQAAITFTDSFGGDYLAIRVTFNRTAATWTLPANSLGKYVAEDGTVTTSGTNTIVIAGATSGDIIEVVRKKTGSNYSWIASNMGQ